MGKRILKITAIVAAIGVVALIGLGFWMRGQLTGSLPRLDGEVSVPGLAASVVIERDGLGIPTIRAGNRIDLAMATGFVHAQERFFQMDLLRRNSAGELSEIVGAAALEHDSKVRVNRFRDVAQRVVTEGSSEDRDLLEAYAKGVNAGLAALAAKPFEYLLLGATPAPWKPEDCALVMFSMYLDLQNHQFPDECRRGMIDDLLGHQMLEFLAPRGTQWDAPIVGEAFSVPPIPGSDVLDLRIPEGAGEPLTPPDVPAKATSEVKTFHPGSNNWAVAGSQTADGRALLAGDMHLDIRVPHIWYRASFVWPAEGQPAAGSTDKDAAPAADDKAGEKPKRENRVTGVTLPGTPAMVVGSNGHLAWAFTNAEGDWADAVIVETVPDDKESYLTPDGPRKFEHHAETIKVKGSPDETLDVVTTIWGPIVDHDHKDRPRAIRWVAHDPAAVNMGLMRLEAVDSLDEALRLANLSGSPAQNFMVADDKGRIAWTILGRIPRRVGFDGWLPTSWADGKCRWDGYLAPEEYPRIVDPASGKLWTANARVVSGEMLAKLGDGGYDLGARAQQIRDDLLTTEKASEADMLRIQLDDRAVFLEPWRKLLLDTLTPEAIDDNPRRGELRRQVEHWGGHAAADSVGYRAVREFRQRLITQVSDQLVHTCKLVDPRFTIAKLDRTEGPVWRLVSEKPAHMLDPRYESWNAQLLASADAVIADATAGGAKLTDYTWGEFNTTRIKHPLSDAVPALATWLDMAPRALAGDSANMPRIQGPDEGASQRMGVSPGHEADGYMHMPCGQSGHPLSPHYNDAHQAWEEGKPTPFLPGETVHKLVLKPAA